MNFWSYAERVFHSLVAVDTLLPTPLDSKYYIHTKRSTTCTGNSTKVTYDIIGPRKTKGNLEEPLIPWVTQDNHAWVT